MMNYSFISYIYLFILLFVYYFITSVMSNKNVQSNQIKNFDLIKP